MHTRVANSVIRSSSRLISLVLALSFFAVLSGCASSVGGGVSKSFDLSGLDDSNVMVVDSQIRVYELSLSGTEEVPDWSKEAKAMVDKTINSYLETDLGWKASAAPELTEEQRAVLDEYTALYEILALQHLNRNAMQGWVEHRPDFDVTLGPGLAFVKELGEHDMALLSIGEEYNTSGGRAAASFVMAALVGQALPSGHALLHLGLVDLESGDLTWTNTAISTTHNLKDQTGSRSMVKKAFSGLNKKPE